jgi:hypothetical protein
MRFGTTIIRELEKDKYRMQHLRSYIDNFSPINESEDSPVGMIGFVASVVFEGQFNFIISDYYYGASTDIWSLAQETYKLIASDLGVSGQLPLDMLVLGEDGNGPIELLELLAGGENSLGTRNAIGKGGLTIKYWTGKYGGSKTSPHLSSVPTSDPLSGHKAAKLIFPGLEPFQSMRYSDVAGAGGYKITSRRAGGYTLDELLAHSIANRPDMAYLMREIPEEREKKIIDKALKMNPKLNQEMIDKLKDKMIKWSKRKDML